MAALQGETLELTMTNEYRPACRPPNESQQETKRVEEEALPSALQGRAGRTDDECPRGTLSWREQSVEESSLLLDDWMGF